MRRGTDAHLRRYRLLLDTAAANATEAEVVWRSARLGSWRNISARWWESAGRIGLSFKAPQGKVACWVSSVRRTANGLKILVSDARKPLPEELHVLWREPSRDAGPQPVDSWKPVQLWLKERFPGSQVLSVSRRPDLAHSLSGSFLRVRFRSRGNECLALAADAPAGDEDSRKALTQALICLDLWLGPAQRSKIPEVHLIVPDRQSGIVFHRARFVNQKRIRVSVWEFSEDRCGAVRIRPASPPPEPVEERDFRWPVLGPFRWSAQIARVLDLAPRFIRRYPRFQDFDSLRLWGLEFAQAVGPDRDSISFGVGGSKTELDEDLFPQLCALVDEILFYRRPDSPDVTHPFYRAQSER
ncbi:MAG TPA: hypothetical protein VE398_05640, partial [Acidobacteriota bacterium]|nr:hypothetical protein [Acidobacteriota bacterium]